MPGGVQDRLGGRLKFTIRGVPSAGRLSAWGGLRPLAVPSFKRLPNYPDVPPISETFAGVEVIGWFIIAAPAGAPPQIVARQNRELDQIFKDPEVAGQLAAGRFFAGGGGPPGGQRGLWEGQKDALGK